MKLVYIFFLLCWSFQGSSQNGIAGKVVSEKGDALQGASVFISNTTIGVSTNAKGEFMLPKVPAGSTNIIISYVGYEVASVTIPASKRSQTYIIELQLKVNNLSTVIVGKYDKRGWKKWGKIFVSAFIGNSFFAKACRITNKDVIRFNYNKKTAQLRAYAEEPVMIENKALGYNISVTLIDFVCDISISNVDYQVYSLFSEMQGTDDDELEWKKNREDVYSLSLMHFMRALYSNNLKNEGYRVRVLERKQNSEKQRVRTLNKSRFSNVKDSLEGIGNDEVLIKSIEAGIPKDSLLYYNAVLQQDDHTENLHQEPVRFRNIASRTDSGNVLFEFKDILQVTYVKMKEPKEYTVYKNKLYYDTKGSHRAVYPITELSLTHNIPVEVTENGYFNNIDLYLQGFWGWWEKMATKLPYEYEP